MFYPILPSLKPSLVLLNGNISLLTFYLFKIYSKFLYYFCFYFVYIHQLPRLPLFNEYFSILLVSVFLLFHLQINSFPQNFLSFPTILRRRDVLWNICHICLSKCKEMFSTNLAFNMHYLSAFYRLAFLSLWR